MRVKAKFDLSKWNGPQIAQRARFVFGKYTTQVWPKFQESIEEQKFTWPNVTIRQNGQVATSPRNIVDTGAFKASQERVVLGATSCLYKWDVPYSSLILTGYRTSKGTQMPARDWITPVLKTEFPMDRFFEKEFKRLGF